MKIMHISDLHLGKKVNEVSMIEEQEYILKKILEVLDEEKPEVLLIAGDIYDKPVPPVQAVNLLDDFICELSKRKLITMIISGNHDSPERLAFGGRIFKENNIYISTSFNDNVDCIKLKDEYGDINFYLLPFIKPINVRHLYPAIDNYNDMMKAIVLDINIDRNNRNVLMTHQFITGAERSESEEINVGGADNIDANVFKDFDYVALGHIHSPQNFLEGRIRYCGTPLKYSFSEKHEKSITIIELGKKESDVLCDINKKLIPLKPRYDFKSLRGTYEELTLRANYKDLNLEDFFYITLIDEDDIPNAISNLRVIYKNILKLDYDNKRTRESKSVEVNLMIASKSPLENFIDFYEMQNNEKPSDEQIEILEGEICDL